MSSTSHCWSHHLKGGCCESRFGENEKLRMTCYHGLIQSSKSNTTAKECLVKYKQCMQPMRHKVDKCLRHMTPVCNAASFSAIKTVRLTMTSLYELRERLVNLRAVHLIRDPRAVGLSRMQDVTYRAKGSRNPIMEAALYCRSVSRDLEVLTRFQRDFPGSVLPIVYEQFAVNPVQVTEKIYEFLGQTLPKIGRAHV